MTKNRYVVCIFPSLEGTPWHTDTRGKAIALGYLRWALAALRFDARTIEVYEGNEIIKTL